MDVKKDQLEFGSPKKEQTLEDFIHVKRGKGVVGFADGNSYNGQWQNGCFDGYGEYAWTDGRKYRGYFRKGKMHGKGEFLWPDGKRFEGEYNMDMAQGHGIVTLADGRIFEGEFKDDFPTTGQMIESNGDTFRASFDGSTFVSEWSPLKKIKVGRFEIGWRSIDQLHSVREFTWSDGRGFAGSCIGYCPSVGVYTDINGDQYAVTYAAASLFTEEPTPIIKMRLKTQAAEYFFNA